MIREAIVKLVNKENLTYEMAEGAMDEIMGGKADPIQISAFLTAMTSPSAVLAVTFKVSGSVASSAAREWYLATGTVSGSPWNNSEVRSSVVSDCLPCISCFA